MDHLISPSFHNHLKNFIIAAKQYSYCHDESSLNGVLCSLQILGQLSNEFTLNSKDTLRHEFFINLYELMRNTNDDSEIMWAAVNFLQSIVKQGFFHSTILNSNGLTLILTKLLKDELALDKKIKILKLLQELTYKMKLQWQESHSSELITLLIKWISTEDKDLISLSLGVLVNVCCKNKFAMFTLVKCTHSKSFMRLLLKLQSDDIFIKVQVYKLLLILEHVSGQIPQVDVNNLIDVTFVVLEEGLKLKNVFVLRHAVDFFIDISEHSRWKNSVLEYEGYKTNLIKILESMNNFKCIEKTHNNYHIILQSVDLLLQFIHHVVQFKNEDLIILYPKIIMYILHWTQFSNLHEQSISILQTITINVRSYNSYMDQTLQCDIYENLEKCLYVLLMILFEPNKNVENDSNICIWNKHAICLRFLQEMLKIQQLYEIIDENLNISSLQSLFHSLILIDINNLNDLQNVTFVYIEALCFLSELVAKNPTWMSLYSEILNQKHVYRVLAFIIYRGSKNMKQKVLDLITKFSQQSTLMLSDCLEEIEQLSLAKVKIVTENSVETAIKPMCTFAQEEQIQMFIDKLENIFNSNEILSIKSSNVIMLYQYKMNTLKQTEVWLKQSLDNASEEITRLNYKIVCLNSESMQLNQMLLDDHKEIEELTTENENLKKKLNDITEQFATTSNNFAKLSQNYESKRQIIQEQNTSIKNLEKQLEELRLESDEMKADLLNQLKNEKAENKIQVSKLEQQLMEKQSIVNEKTEEINNKISFIKNLENISLEKDKDIIDLRKQLQEQQRVREMISQMLAATSSKP
uniref:Protein CIP2A n=1 Tax=Melanaphis sacchari TaxID=742174 RepID=A0A2H8TVK4_9HEMI